MKKLWKNLAYGSALVAVSVVASATTVLVMDAERDDLDEIAYIHPHQSTALDYGFQNTAYSHGSKPVGAAPDLTPAAESSVLAVVHIKVEKEQQSSMSQAIDPFEFFFGRGSGMQRRNTPVVGYGSGVIISNDGYIITNNHVIDNSDKVSVTLNDNRTFNAKLIGTDPSTDIALLKIDAKELPTIPFGDSDKLRLGEWVLAVGNPFNLTGTVTAGIISAKSRNTGASASGQLKAEAFIQTDAAVNSGNSGGALVNAAGELIGINTMIYSQTGNYAGYSFAVPINMAAKVVEDIKKFGTVQRALLGVAGRDVDADLVKQENLKVNKGFYIGDFSEISAALAAGIEKGDVLVAINNAPVDNFGQLQEQISRYRPGDVVQVKVNRKGTEKVYKVTLKNVDGGQGVIKQNSNAERLGAQLRALDSQQLRSYGLSYGVEVERISSGALKSVGVKEGFIILTANDRPIRSVSDLNKVVSQTLEVRGRSQRLYIRGFYPRSGDVVAYDVELK